MWFKEETLTLEVIKIYSKQILVNIIKLVKIISLNKYTQSKLTY